MSWSKLFGFMTVLLILGSNVAVATMRITEWQYNGSEFIEFTNLSGASINMSGWSFADDSRAPGTVSLSAFGTVVPYESVILSEASTSAFRSLWSLPASIKVIGGNTNNLGRNDEINLYDNLGTLIDRLTYGDQNFPGSIRTEVNSGNPNSLAVVGTNDVLSWKFSVLGDEFGSYLSGGGHLGNPGKFALVPEPTSLLLMVGSAALVALRRRRIG